MASNVYTASNVVLGAASRVQIGADGSYTASDCPSVGYTKGDVVLTTTTTYAYKEPDQARGRVGAKFIEERAQVTVPLDEVTLANMAKALGYPTSAVAGGVLSFGGGSTNQIYELWVVGDAPSSGTRTLHVHQCVPDGEKAYAMKKGEETVYEVTFECLQDTSQTAGEQIFQITDT